jgi:hypothetical protein
VGLHVHRRAELRILCGGEDASDRVVGVGRQLDVFLNGVGADGDRAAFPASAEAIAWARGSTTLPAAQTPELRAARCSSGRATSFAPTAC